MNTKLSFSGFIKLWGVLLIIGFGSIHIGYELFESYSSFNASTKKMQENYIAQQKELVKQEVNRVVDLINYKLKKGDKEGIKEELLEIISRIRFGKEGYIFVNSLDGNALITNGKILSGSKKLWEEFPNNSDKLKNLFDMEYKAAQKPNGDYIYYSFIKLSNSKKESPKVSFIFGIKDLNWLVGAGVYLDDVEEKIAILHSELKEQATQRLISSLSIIVLVALLFLFLINLFSKNLKNDFELFDSFFRSAAYEDRPVELKKIKFLEFEELAKNANKMLQDKVQTQHELLAEREQLFVTIRSVGDGLITTNSVGEIELMNTVAEKLTGWKNEDAKGEKLDKIFNIINENTRTQVENPVNRVLEEGVMIGLANHTILISKDGNEYNIADSAAPIKDDKNNIIGVVLVFRDITEEYRIQEEIRKSEEKYRTVADYTYDWEYWVNPKGEYTYISPSCERITGYSRKEFLQNQNFLVSIVHKDDVGLIENYMHKVSRTREIKQIEFRITTKSGEERWIGHLCQSVYNTNGEYIGQRGSNRDITEYKKINEALKESEEKFRRVFYTSPDAITISRLSDGLYYDVNEGFTEITGYSREEALGKTPFDLNIWANKEDRIRFTDELRKNGKVVNLKAKSITKSGKEYVGLVSAEIIDLSGVPYIITIGRDISEIEITQNKLKESERRYSNIVEGLLVGVAIYIEDKIVFANKAIRDMLGLVSKRDYIGKNILDFIHPNDQDRIMKIIKGMQDIGITNNSPTLLKHKLIKKDGSEIIVETVHSQINYYGNNASMVMIKDVTERSRAEEELRRSKEFNKSITQSAADAIISIDESGKIIMWNNAATTTKIFGYSANEMTNNNISKIIPSHFIDRHLKGLEKTEDGDETLLGAAKIELYAIRKNGEKFPIDLSLSSWTTKGEKYFTGIVRDITKQKESEREILASKEKAEKADKMKSIFLAQMSHEIRTPINALVSMSSLLRYDFEDIANEDQLMSFDIIDRAGNRIIRTVDLLLNLSEIQAGTYEVNPSKFDLYAEILSQIVSGNRKLAEKKGVKLSLNILTKNTDLISDSYTVNQIFVQLVDNAIKYTDKGEINISIRRDEENNLIVEIKDTGIGIEEEYLPSLFEPFSQEEMGYTRKYEGNGIGMALVRKYCELNNAIIKVKSTKGVGTTFIVIFNT